MRYYLSFVLGMLFGCALFQIAFVELTKNRVNVAVEACGSIHKVSHLAWHIWAANPGQYPASAPAFITTRMEAGGVNKAICMLQQLEPEALEPK